MNRKNSSRIAAAALVLHGLLEISALFAPKLMTTSLISFGGMDQAQIEANGGSIATLGVLWGLTRFAAAGGAWKLKKWGIALGIIMSLVTLVAAVTIIPAGVADTFIAALALAFLLYTWFGSQQIEV